MEPWIQTAESATLDRLEPLAALGYRVERVPSGQPASKARIFCYYAGSTFAEPQLLQTLSQDETVQFQLILEFRDARGPKSAYPALWEIERLLTGFQPLGQGKIRFQSQQLSELDEGLWAYTIRVAFDRERQQQRV